MTKVMSKTKKLFERSWRPLFGKFGLYAEHREEILPAVQEQVTEPTVDGINQNIAKHGRFALEGAVVLTAVITKEKLEQSYHVESISIDLELCILHTFRLNLSLLRLLAYQSQANNSSIVFLGV